MSEPSERCQSGCIYFQPNPAELDAGLRANVCRVIDELSLLFEISQTLEQSFDLSRVMGPVLEKMGQLFGMRCGAVAILEPHTRSIRFEESYGVVEKTVMEHLFQRADELIHECIATGKPLVVPDITKDAHFADFVEDAPPKPQHTLSFMIVPIKMGQEVVGTLSIEREAPRTRGFDADLRLLTLIASVISRAVELRQKAQETLEGLREENERLHETLKSHFRPRNIIGNSSAMVTVYRHIEQVADSSTNVLVRGESGTGKELVAHAIHEKSPRKDRAFVKFNCAALPESIIESELFGHEKGAFTGALTMRKGRFEVADGGTIFLDEIGDISPQTQVKLLRVLQEKVIERVGSHQAIPCNVRVIAATNRNLEAMIAEGKFRDDLYYRLNVFPVYIPPLRDRKSDVLVLADHFIEKFASENQKPINRISTAAIDLLMAYHWPGNVRELENCLERAVLLCNGKAIEAHHLPPTLQMKDGEEKEDRGALQAALDGLEREMIVDSLKRHSGIMSKTARELGLTERQIGTRVKKYAIDFKRFREDT